MRFFVIKYFKYTSKIYKCTHKELIWIKKVSEILEGSVHHDHVVVAEDLRRTVLLEAQAAVGTTRASSGRVLHTAMIGHPD